MRQQLTWRLAQQGIHVEPGQVVLTDGGTHALDHVCRFLLEPGDTVLLDDPCYFNFQALLRAHRVPIVSVPFTPSGPDLAHFERALIEHRPRLYISNAAIQNPTGATLAPAVVHRLLKLAGDHDLLIVEDDIFADFESEPTPRLAAFDGLMRVVSIGSAGMFVWARLPSGLDAAQLARHALAENVIFAPGNVFSASQTVAQYMRFNVSRCKGPKVYEILQRAMEIARRFE